MFLVGNEGCTIVERVERLPAVPHANMRDVISWLDKGLYKLALIKPHIAL